ncbi:MAG: hypothetical protein Q4C99_10755, partial [Clostridia bacterium]|nr:hypothetical protein [Clostridia bacterium]
MKKGLKKMLSCLTAAVMVMSTLPFATVSAQAATSTATVSSYNVFKGDESNTRFNSTNKILKICNDNTRENFTIGFVNFDVSNVSCSASDVVSANYTFTVNMDSGCNDNEGLSVYYPLINTDDFLNYTKSSTYNTKGSYLGSVSSTSYNTIYTGGTGSKNTGADFIGHAKTNYMLQLIAEYDTNPTTATSKTIDIGPAVKAAKLAGKSTATICFMLKNAGDTDEGSKGWSDTSVTVNTNSVTVNTNTASYSSTKSNINSKINQTKTFGSDVHKNSATSGYMNGVKVSGEWQDESQRMQNGLDLRVTGIANQVAVYTGSNDDIRFPFILRNVGGNSTGSSVALFFDYASYNTGSFATSGQDWRRCNSYNNFTDASNSEMVHNFSSVNGSTNTSGKYFMTKDDKSFKNYIKYTGSGNTTNYYDKLSNFSFNIKYGKNNSRTTSTIQNQNASLYVINYAPVKTLIESSDFKTKYNNISTNESIYETTSLTNYYNAVNDLLNFDVLDGVTASNASTTVPQKGTKIKELLEAYN